MHHVEGGPDPGEVDQPLIQAGQVEGLAAPGVVTVLGWNLITQPVRVADTTLHTPVLLGGRVCPGAAVQHPAQPVKLTQG